LRVKELGTGNTAIRQRKNIITILVWDNAIYLNIKAVAFSLFVNIQGVSKWLGINFRVNSLGKM
jgi:hypothetical protein